MGQKIGRVELIDTVDSFTNRKLIFLNFIFILSYCLVPKRAIINMWQVTNSLFLFFPT